MFNIYRKKNAHSKIYYEKIDVYCCRNGRPGSQSVSEKFDLSWGTYMSSKKDVVYIKLDVRGSRGHGSHAIYRHLGRIEVQDQIHVLR